jgi:protein AaeX
VRFTEIDLFGDVAPMSLMMVAAWLVTIALRRVAARSGLLRYVWHPALFVRPAGNYRPGFFGLNPINRAVLRV